MGDFDINQWCHRVQAIRDEFADWHRRGLQTWFILDLGTQMVDFWIRFRGRKLTRVAVPVAEMETWCPAYILAAWAKVEMCQ